MRVRSDRRRFLQSTAIAGFGIWTAGQTAWARRAAPSEQLNVAVIGAGGRGGSDLAEVAQYDFVNIVALCDVDQQRAAGAFQKFPKARQYADFRKLLDAQKDLDAVVVATPDHMHAPISLAAMRRGKHVYCEKPLTHSVDEARRMRETAAQYGVQTQMGNQGHSMDGQRQAVEVIRSGAIGKVSAVHVWTDRPGRFWPQPVERPAETPPVPSTLDWDLWLGVAPKRPYHSAYAPFVWRGWWDYGTGALGDMACHVADLPYAALELDSPTSIEAEVPELHAEGPPAWSIIRYEFPARGEQPPVKLTWYDGGKKPATDELPGAGTLPDNGIILVGDKGMLVSEDPYGAQYQLLPEKAFADYQPPEPTLPRSPGHHLEWLLACKGQGQALSSFDYSARLTEAVLLGNVALRVGQRIDWDAEAMRVTNLPDANQYLRREYRPGWEI